MSIASPSLIPSALIVNSRMTAELLDPRVSRDVEVESSETTSCDSSGLCLLLPVQRDLNAAGRRLCLVNPVRAPLRLLDLSSTRQLFDIRTCSSTLDG